MAAGEYWTSADIVDCIVSYTVTQLMDIMTDVNSRDGAEMLAKVCMHNKSCTHPYLVHHSHDTTLLIRCFPPLVQPGTAPTTTASIKCLFCNILLTLDTAPSELTLLYPCCLHALLRTDFAMPVFCWLMG